MNLHLFNRPHTCDDLGVCQRTGPACRQACHMSRADPPIGYEPTHGQTMLPKGARFTPFAQPADETADRSESEWELIGRLAGYVGAAVLCLLILLAAIGWTITTDSSAMHWLQQLGRAAMQSAG